MGVSAFGDVDAFEVLTRAGVKASVVHAGRYCRGGGVELLDLVWHKVLVFHIKGKLDGIIEGGTWVGGDKVGDDELFFVLALVFSRVGDAEGVVDGYRTFTHTMEDVVANVLGGNF